MIVREKQPAEQKQCKIIKAQKEFQSIQWELGKEIQENKWKTRDRNKSYNSNCITSKCMKLLTKEDRVSLNLKI